MATNTQSSFHAGVTFRSHPLFDLIGGAPDWTKPLTENYEIVANSRGCVLELATLVDPSSEDPFQPLFWGLVLKLDYPIDAGNAACAIQPLAEFVPPIDDFSLTNSGLPDLVGPYYVGLPAYFFVMVHINPSLKFIFPTILPGEIPTDFISSFSIDLFRVGITGAEGYQPTVIEEPIPTP